MTGYSTYFTALTGSSGANLVGGGIIGLNAAIPSAQFAATASREGAYSNSGTSPSPTTRVPLPRVGMLLRFNVDVITNTLVNSLTVDLLLNGVVQATLTYLAAATGKQSAAGSFAVFATDEVSFRYATAVTGMVGQTAPFIASVEFLPT